MSRAQTWCSSSTQEEAREHVGRRERNRASSKSIGQGAFIISCLIGQGGLSGGGGLLGLWGVGGTRIKGTPSWSSKIPSPAESASQTLAPRPHSGLGGWESVKGRSSAFT